MKKFLIQGFFGVALISLFFSIMILMFNLKDNKDKNKEVELICKVTVIVNKENQILNTTVNKGSCHEE